MTKLKKYALLLTLSNQLYVNHVKFQPIKCTQFVGLTGLSNQKAPFDNLDFSLKWFFLALVNGVSRLNLRETCSQIFLLELSCNSVASKFQAVCK